MSKDKRKTLSVKVNEEYAAEVWDFAYKHKMNLSDLIRSALELYMEVNREEEENE